MKFYVVNSDYEPVSEALDNLLEATQHAISKVIVERTIPYAIILGLDSATFRTDVPAPIYLIVNAGYDLLQGRV